MKIIRFKVSIYGIDNNISRILGKQFKDCLERKRKTIQDPFVELTRKAILESMGISAPESSGD